MSSRDALSPGKTGGVGSAIFSLHDNGTLDYQVYILHGAHQRLKRTTSTRVRMVKLELDLPVGD